MEEEHKFAGTLDTQRTLRAMKGSSRAHRFLQAFLRHERTNKKRKGTKRKRSKEEQQADKMLAQEFANVATKIYNASKRVVRQGSALNTQYFFFNKHDVGPLPEWTEFIVGKDTINLNRYNDQLGLYDREGHQVVVVGESKHHPQGALRARHSLLTNTPPTLRKAPVALSHVSMTNLDQAQWKHANKHIEQQFALVVSPLQAFLPSNNTGNAFLPCLDTNVLPVGIRIPATLLSMQELSAEPGNVPPVLHIDGNTLDYQHSIDRACPTLRAQHLAASPITTTTLVEWYKQVAPTFGPSIHKHKEDLQ